MQRANCIVRLRGSLTNTVPRQGVTPAEILVLRHIHGDDAVVDIRPTEFDKKIRPEQEFSRLSQKYNRGGSGFGAKPGEGAQSITEQLFPGAIKRLPLTLEEIGVDTGEVAQEQAPVPDLPDLQPGDADQADDDEANAGGENAAGADGGENAASSASAE